MRKARFTRLSLVLVKYSAPAALTCSLALRFIVRPLSLRQFSPQDFSRRGAWHLVDELDFADAFVVGDPLLHESDELVRRGLHVRAQLHESLRDLAGLLVWLADDAGVGDSGVLAEHRLDLRRPDAEALVLDELLLAVDDEDITVVVTAADVAGVEPAIADDVDSVLRLVPVAAHNPWAANADLADLAVLQGLRAGLEVDDLVLGAGNDPADRLEDRRVDGIRVGHRRRLGEPVALDDRLPDALDHPARRVRREWRRATEEEAHRREVVLLHLRAHREAEDDRRHDEADRRPAAFDERAVLDHVEARHRHLRRPETDGSCHEQIERVDVEVREDI